MGAEKRNKVKRQSNRIKSGSSYGYKENTPREFELADVKDSHVTILREEFRAEETVSRETLR